MTYAPDPAFKLACGRLPEPVGIYVRSHLKNAPGRLQVLGVFGPRHLVDARRCHLLQIGEARSQDVDVDVMQERRQLALPVPDDRFSCADLRL